MKQLFIGFCLCTFFWGSAQGFTAEELLDRSIAYHDPNGKWQNFQGEFMVEMETPNRPKRTTRLEMDFPKERFKSSVTQNGIQTAALLEKGNCTHWYEGSTAFSKEQAKQHRLNCERTTKMRNYYVYLYGLPMKLKDPGTKLDPKVYNKRLKGEEYWCIKVNYEETVGKDTWYFYFDKNDYRLRHYQFYHDEAKNDGEYILMAEEVTVKGIKMPKVRAWYTNGDERYLGTDVLLVE